MFTKNIKDYFTDDLLNTVRGVLGEAKKCSEDCTCEKCESEKDEMTEGKRGLWDNIHAKRKRIKAGSGERMRKPGSEGAPSNADLKAASEGVMPTADEPSDKDKKTAQKIRDMMAKEKKPVKEEADAPKLPFDGPYRKVGEKRKDQYGNEIKNVAKHLAKKAMNAQKNEEVELEEGSQKPYVSASPGGVGRSAEANVLNSKGKTAMTFTKKEHGPDYMKKANAHLKKNYNKLMGEEADQIDELSKATMGSYVNKAKDQIDAASYRQGHRDSRGAGGNNPASNAIEKKLTKRHKGIETAVSKLTKEESEQIDELSKATMGRYINKAATKMGSQGVTAGLKIAADEKSSKNFKDMGKREKGIKLAVSKLTKEEQDFIDALNADTLEEGRGRPPKEGSAAWKARQGKADDDMVALGMQLRKAQSINKKVRFMDGKEHDIHQNHITRFNDHMGARRTTQEKDNFQRQAHKSHADFVKAVSAPVPKASKDTGEIVKYR
jgi:hypothetical protein